MDINAIIINFIQVGVAILGFSGIVIALVSRAGQASNSFKLAFNLVLTFPLGFLFAALVGLVSFNSTLSTASASQIASSVCGLYLLAVMVIRNFQIKKIKSDTYSGFTMFRSAAIPLRVLALSIMVVHGLNVIWYKSPLIYMAGFSLFLFFGLIVFTVFLWEVWNDESG